GLRPGDLTHAVQTLLDHHDALRMRRTTGRDGAWELETLPRGTLPAAGRVTRVDVEGLEPEDTDELIERHVRAAQSRLDPEAAAVVEVVWFDAGPDDDGLLLLMVHHLVVDGVSWRILVSDLATACRALSGGRLPDLAPVPTSLRTWSRSLAWAASDPGRVARLPEWTGLHEGTEPLLGGRPLNRDLDVVGRARTLTVSLPPETVTPLITDVPEAFYAGVDDVLLTALAVTAVRWAWRHWPAGRAPGHDDGLLVTMEGHGRDDIAPDQDLSRTVGWFTSAYPIRPVPGTGDHRSGPELVRALKAVKEHLRALPPGIDYGLLRHLNPWTRPVLEALPRPQISFNYLGRFAAAGGEARGWETAPAWEPVQFRADPGMPLIHPLEIVAFTEDTSEGPWLTAHLMWPDELLTEEQVSELAELWSQALCTLAAHVSETGAGGFTPSDLAPLAVTQQEIERLEREWAPKGGVTDVLPLSPLQEGLLFHAVAASREADAYALHMVLELGGPLRAATLRASAEELLSRHANLRASFVALDSGRTVQIIPRRVDLPWREYDLTGLGPAERAGERDRLVAEELRVPFELSEGPLCGFTLIRLAKDRHVLLVRNHHILWDGWSNSTILAELFEIYRRDGSASSLPEVAPFRGYLRWLAGQDAGADRAAWRRSLEGLEEATHTATAGTGAGAAPGGAPPEHVGLHLPADVTSGLAAMARADELTLNTQIQAVWSLVVSRLTGRRDVVFGKVVSGRPPELRDIDRMVGLLINTVPVRNAFDASEPLIGMLRRLQEEQAVLLAHQHLGLADIHRAAGLRDLFDSVVVVENHRLAEESLLEGTGLHLVGAEAADSTHYPLTLTVVPGERLDIDLGYRSDVFDRATAEEIAGWVRRLLTTLADDRDRPVGDLVDGLTSARGHVPSPAPAARPAAGTPQAASAAR
ncbi:condensation domain-containing protein, partial [Streptosporangium sp. NPDC048865]|uniref:condensation domain-containing protein n=1 Tax=Streptosporangium sp. NPDC048865 TaxID=3155766 RepID=UPI0034219910